MRYLHESCLGEIGSTLDPLDLLGQGKGGGLVHQIFEFDQVIRFGNRLDLILA